MITRRPRSLDRKSKLLVPCDVVHRLMESQLTGNPFPFLFTNFGNENLGNHPLSMKMRPYDFLRAAWARRLWIIRRPAVTKSGNEILQIIWHQKSVRLTHFLLRDLRKLH